MKRIDRYRIHTVSGRLSITVLARSGTPGLALHSRQRFAVLLRSPVRGCPSVDSQYYDRNRAASCMAIQGVREQGMHMTGRPEYFAETLAAQLAEIRQRGAIILTR